MIERIIRSTDTILSLIFREFRTKVQGNVHSRFTGGRIGIYNALQEHTLFLGTNLPFT